MRTFALLLCAAPFLSVGAAYGAHEFPREEAKASVVTTEQFEHDRAELAAGEDHADFYLVLRLEVSSLRREYPEHRQFLDQYLKHLMP
jgi:hypothetical protein